MNLREFFKGKTVLITGHTGFKGAWLSIWLNDMGAKVIGYSLEPPYQNSLFELSGIGRRIIDIRADVRDFHKLDSVFSEYKPDIVIHLAAQAIVRLSYDIPVETFTTNAIGTLNILECIRNYKTKSAVLITSDKCYKNVEKEGGYAETDELSDQEPYSCSKGCAEMIAQSYRFSFNLKIATARAGNVLGGGDWAKDRLVPDIIRSLKRNEPVIIRNPNSTRPWQFVLEPLRGYLILAKRQYEGENLSGGWNFGPDRDSIIPVEELAKSITDKWGFGILEIQKENSNSDKHEANLLFLDASKAKNKLGWKTILNAEKTVNYIVEWYKNYDKEDVYSLCNNQIHKYEKEVEKHGEG